MAAIQRFQALLMVSLGFATFLPANPSPLRFSHPDLEIYLQYKSSLLNVRFLFFFKGPSFLVVIGYPPTLQIA